MENPIIYTINQDRNGHYIVNTEDPRTESRDRHISMNNDMLFPVVYAITKTYNKKGFCVLFSII